MHWVKSVRIRSYSGPHFPAFGLNTERYDGYVKFDQKTVLVVCFFIVFGRIRCSVQYPFGVLMYSFDFCLFLLFL